MDDDHQQMTSRQLQGVDSCALPPNMPVGDPLNTPTFIVPCARHADCLPTAGVRPAFELCCYANLCICGAPPTALTPPNVRCARFACTSDTQCGPGSCINRQCQFIEDDERPGCTTDASCGGGNNVCVNGVCRLRNNATGVANIPTSSNGQPRPPPVPAPAPRPQPVPAPAPRPQPVPAPAPRPQPVPVPVSRPAKSSGGKMKKL